MVDVTCAPESATTKSAPVLFVMVALPASGKSTRAQQIEEERRALRLTPDEWMVPLFNDNDANGKRNVLEGRFIWLALRALRHGIDVVLDFGVWGKDERTALRALAAEVGASCKLVYLEIDEDQQRRGRDPKSLVILSAAKDLALALDLASATPPPWRWRGAADTTGTSPPRPRATGCWPASPARAACPRPAACAACRRACWRPSRCGR